MHALDGWFDREAQIAGQSQHAVVVLHDLPDQFGHSVVAALVDQAGQQQPGQGPGHGLGGMADLR
jgi:hypothetical protein